MNLRTATLSDAAAVAQVHHTTWVTTYGSILPPEFWVTATLERRVATWERWLGNGAAPVIAEVAGEVVGIAMAGESVEQDDVLPVRDQQLYLLYVLAAHHGTGVGQALLDAVVPPGTAAQLWVAEDNPRARRFYERNGFAMEGARVLDTNAADLAEVRMVR
ncbi:GNAT family N-acetyltransferase [Promicromonospora sp. NPDC052451]|uniref:GNAT family N-acetyltransferase n=1 Tax=Promicromonospora sp. NPDC052451 TaxID=3364407 RepID=UPI0037C58A9C